MKKKKERFVVKITTFVPVVFLIVTKHFLPEIIFAICLFFLIITFFYLIVGFVLDFYGKTSLPSLKIKKRPAVKIFINSKEEVIPSGNCVLKKDGTMAFNDGGQEVRREKLMITTV